MSETELIRGVENTISPSAVAATSRWARLAAQTKPYALALILTFLFYFQWFLPGHALVLSDCREFNAPVREYAARAVRSGRLPQWSEQLFGGYPFLSDPQSAVFYPSNLLLSFLTPHPARSKVMDRLALLQIVLIALGAVCLARGLGLGCAGSVTTSLVVTHTGFVISHLCHLPVISALAAGVWSWAFTARAVRKCDARWSLAAGLCLAISIFAGHAQTTLFVCYAAAVGGALLAIECARRALSWRRLWSGLMLCAAVFVVAALGAAIQVLPTGVMLARSTRSVLTLDQALRFSFLPAAFPSLWFPGFYHPLPWRFGWGLAYQTHVVTWLPTGQWEYQLHLGVVCTAAVLFGWMLHFRNWLFQALFWGAILIIPATMGKAGGIYPFLFAHAPGFGQVRIPPRLMCIAFGAWGLLAGAGVDALVREARHTVVRRAGLATLALIAVAWAAGLVTLLVTKARLGSWPEAFRTLFVLSDRRDCWGVRNTAQFTGDIAWQVAVGSFIVLAVCTLLVLAWYGMRRPVVAGLLLLMFAELGIYTYSRNVRCWSGFDDPVGSIMTALPESPTGRVAAIVEAEGPYLENSALCCGIEYLYGYSPLHLKANDTFKPRSAFAAGQIAEEALMDRWNVSDVLFRYSATRMPVPGRSLNLPDAGWILIGRGHKNLRETTTWEVPSNKPVRGVHLVSTAGMTQGLAPGTPIAKLTVEPLGGNTRLDRQVRLGIETSDGKMHAPVPYYRCYDDLKWTGVPSNLVDSSQFYVSSFDTGSTGIVRRIRLTMVGQSHVVLAVSWLAVDYADGTMDCIPGLAAAGYRLLDSRSRDWTVLRRPSSPGFAQLVPWAIPVAAYKDDGERVAALRQIVTAHPPSIMLDTDQISRGEATALNAPRPDQPIGSVTLKRETPERYHVDTETSQSAWLLLSQAHYPGWLATLDGRPVRLFHANGAQFAVALPAGCHRLTMEYRTPLFRTGASTSAVAWLLCGVVLLRRKRFGIPVT